MTDKSKKLSRWYFGGVSSAAAACVTHPLDLLKVFFSTNSPQTDSHYINRLSKHGQENGKSLYKYLSHSLLSSLQVHLQTQQEGKLSIVRSTVGIIRKQGILALYNGLSASLLRQLTYSTIRFGAYEVGKQTFETPDRPLPFYQKLLLAGVSGATGGVFGTPGDVINVRMQNDIKLAPELRRNYKNALDGLLRVVQEEGVRRLFSGCSTATMRAVLMTIGQLSFYDQIKTTLLQTGYFRDSPSTHILSSVSAGAIATTLTQPLDVLKTRAMNAKPGEFKNLLEIFLHTAKLGPLAFFKGYVPAFIRLAPQTILTFVFLEQLRCNFGFYPQPAKSPL